MDLLQEVPPGKYALISVRQPKGQLINIRSQSALYARANQQPTMGRQFKVRTVHSKPTPQSILRSSVFLTFHFVARKLILQLTVTALVMVVDEPLWPILYRETNNYNSYILINLSFLEILINFTYGSMWYCDRWYSVVVKVTMILFFCSCVDELYDLKWLW